MQVEPKNRNLSAMYLVRTSRQLLEDRGVGFDVVLLGCAVAAVLV